MKGTRMSTAHSQSAYSCEARVPERRRQQGVTLFMPGCCCCLHSVGSVVGALAVTALVAFLWKETPVEIPEPGDLRPHAQPARTETTSEGYYSGEGSISPNVPGAQNALDADDDLILPSLAAS